MLEVCAAIIYKDNKVLVAKRALHKSQGGKWEFPGGKLEKGESPEGCLERELMEEMCIKIQVKQFLMENTHRYEMGTIRLMAYRAEYLEGNINLIDHSEVRWVAVNTLGEYDFAEADIPFVEKLIQGGIQDEF